MVTKDTAIQLYRNTYLNQRKERHKVGLYRLQFFPLAQYPAHSHSTSHSLLFQILIQSKQYVFICIHL